MKRTCSIVTALIMAFTIFIIPNLGISYAAGEDEIVPATTEPGVTDDESASVEAKSLGEISVTVDADSITENSITFKWDAVSEAEGYEWSTDDSEWHSLSAEQTSYTLTDLDSGKEYTLYVRAYKTGESGEREYSKDSATGTTKSHINGMLFQALRDMRIQGMEQLALTGIMEIKTPLHGRSLDRKISCSA